MSTKQLLWFWFLWLVTAYAWLRGYAEFIHGMFGQYAAPNARYVRFWVGLLIAGLLVLGGSIYLKNQELPRLALGLVAVPLVVASPYLLFLLGVLVFGGKTRWN